jgi:hypothetical protein
VLDESQAGAGVYLTEAALSQHLGANDENHHREQDPDERTAEEFLEIHAQNFTF